MPPTPDWARGYLGQNIAAAFPNSPGSDTCIGFADAVIERFSGAEPGVHIAGWSWSTASSRAYENLVTADAHGIVIGAGSTTTDRLDVPNALPNVVTTAQVGYDVYAAAATGQVSVYGVDPSAGTACLVGVIAF
jgi:hypothetical protein